VDSFAPPGWVDLAAVEPTILVELRYATAHNFLGRPVAGYLEPRCLLPETTARALASAQQAAAAAGYTLKVYDCYRPTRATADFVAWRGTPDTATRAEFYPALTKQQVFDRGFVAGTHSNHSSGGAVDVTLVRLPAADQPTYHPGDPLVACTAPADQRWPDNSIDMGTGYDCFDTRAHTLDRAVTGAARDHRLWLRRFMTGAGFTNFAGEWWHYDLTPAPNPGQWFDFPVASAALR
jgi:D-alanyl-D-alanine dipeptidase